MVNLFITRICMYMPLNEMQGMRDDAQLTNNAVLENAIVSYLKLVVPQFKHFLYCDFES